MRHELRNDAGVIFKSSISLPSARGVRSTIFSPSIPSMPLSEPKTLSKTVFVAASQMTPQREAFIAVVGPPD